MNFQFDLSGLSDRLNQSIAIHSDPVGRVIHNAVVQSALNPETGQSVAISAPSINTQYINEPSKSQTLQNPSPQAPTDLPKPSNNDPTDHKNPKFK